MAAPYPTASLAPKKPALAAGFFMPGLFPGNLFVRDLLQGVYAFDTKVRGLAVFFAVVFSKSLI